MIRNNNLIYFNNNRHTPLDPSVAELMAHLKDHTGFQIQQIVHKAKTQLGEMLNAAPDEILFTRGTSSSLELGLKCSFELYKSKGKHIITQVSEHPVVLNCCKELETQGAEVTYLPVNREGLIDPDALKQAIRPTTMLVSIMTANNETGVIQPIELISEICKEQGILFLSDGSQFAGKLRCDTKELGMDCLAFGSHKMYGPENIGLLYVHSRHKALKEFIASKVHDDLDPLLIAGFGQAAEVFNENYWEISAHVSRLKNHFEHQLLDIEDLRINGSTRHRLYNTSNLSFPNGDVIIPLLERFDFADNRKQASHVLHAMGLSPKENRNSFRFSFGKQNTMEEVKLLVDAILSNI